MCVRGYRVGTGLPEIASSDIANGSNPRYLYCTVRHRLSSDTAGGVQSRPGLTRLKATLKIHIEAAMSWGSLIAMVPRAPSLYSHRLLHVRMTGADSSRTVELMNLCVADRI